MLRLVFWISVFVLISCALFFRNYFVDYRYRRYHAQSAEFGVVLRTLRSFKNCSYDALFNRIYRTEPIPPSKRKTVLFRVASVCTCFAVLALVCSGLLYISSERSRCVQQGSAEALSAFDSAAYERGAVTPEKMRAFYADPLNFCAVCGRHRYEPEWTEIGGEEERVGSTTVFVCDWHYDEDSFSVYVNGQTYVFSPAEIADSSAPVPSVSLSEQEQYDRAVRQRDSAKRQLDDLAWAAKLQRKADGSYDTSSIQDAQYAKLCDSFQESYRQCDVLCQFFERVLFPLERVAQGIPPALSDLLRALHAG